MFRDSDRLIYQCPVTGLHHDPLTVKRNLLIAGRGQLNAAFVLYGSTEAPPEKRASAEAVIVATTRAAMGLKAIDPKTGEGVPDEAVIRAIAAFTKWLRGKGSPVQSGPNSAPCTDCPPAAI